MDPSESSEKGGGGSRAFRIWIALCCCWIFYLVISFLSSFLFGFVGLTIERFSASGMFSVPSTCRILATSVDLRSTEVCEIGIWNHKAKNVFYRMKKGSVHCHSDYYWASVFKVEYEEYFSGHVFVGVAEVPREALPHDCRPDFGTAWLTASKFKVNETYSCSYLLGRQKVDIHSSDHFDCRAKKPSTADTIKGYYILQEHICRVMQGALPPLDARAAQISRFLLCILRTCIGRHTLRSVRFLPFLLLRLTFPRGFNRFGRLFSKTERSGHEMAYAMSGAVAGMLISIFTIALTKCVHILTRIMVRKWNSRRLRTRDIARQLQRVCLLLAYFSAITWLSLQYCRLTGLKHLLYDSNFRARTV